VAGLAREFGNALHSASPVANGGLNSAECEALGTRLEVSEKTRTHPAVDRSDQAWNNIKGVRDRLHLFTGWHHRQTRRFQFKNDSIEAIERLLQYILATDKYYRQNL
jgi:hypothetical protein